ncbi:MAG: beta-lactamase induction protein [Rhodanobacter sp.]|jgi:AmpE protein|nr:beta-lactamase induction protein [Rhodanobacter sp.]
MAQTLLVVLLVIASSLALPDLARLRNFSWLHALVARWMASTSIPVLVLPIAIFVLCLWIHWALMLAFFGLPAFAFAVIVLFYAWGPRDLDADVDAVLKAPDSDRRYTAAQALRPDPATAALAVESAPLVEAVFLSALSRWFGVLFWFVLLGPAGALTYRIVHWLARHPTFAADIDTAPRATLEHSASILDWAPAHLIALTLALVSQFDSVISTWRAYHTAHGRGYFTLDLGFLGALARAGVDADIVAGDGYAPDVSQPMAELAGARRVLRRILVVWLVVIALLALSGFTHG